MSILAPHTEKQAIRLLAQCLPYFDKLSTLAMTAEDAFEARKAENLIRWIIASHEHSDNSCHPFPIDNLYTLVLWPEVQELMEHEWFRRECFLHQAFDDQEYHSSAYFVPLSRMLEITPPG